MSFTTIAILLLLSCLCATGTSLHGLSEEPLQEEGILVVTIIVITKIRLDITAATATLQFCAEDDLPPGSPSLNIVFPSAVSYIVDGSRDVNDPTCAIFIIDPSFTLPDDTTRYEFLVFDPDTNDFGRCVSTFAMTAKTTLLTCGTEVFTKVTWGDPTPIVYTVCLEPDPALLAEDVCYYKGDVWAKDFCFRIEDQGGATIIICMSGLTSVIAGEGSVSTNYFYYGTNAVCNNGAGKATLSLALGTPGRTYSRVIMRLVDSAGVPGDATVRDCPNNECTFNSYARRFAHYEVCVEALDDNKVTIETASTTFTEMNLNVFDGGSQKRAMMGFIFANGLDSMTYGASYSLTEPTYGVLGPVESNTAIVNCTHVLLGDPCIGYLDTGTSLGTVYLEISDLTGINTIVTPYVIQRSLTLQ